MMTWTRIKKYSAGEEESLFLMLVTDLPCKQQSAGN
ncbi:uncharacterized protein METZ01_LOCUS43401, partial [marine metagenome]